MSSNTHRRVTLKDLGLKLGLSARAVSQALSDGEGTVKVSAATRERVKALAKELGYRHNLAAKALRTGKTGTLGVLTFHSFPPLAVQRIHYTLEAIKCQSEVTPLIYHSESTDEESCHKACNAMLDAKVDGVLILNPSQEFAHQTRLLELGIPVVSVGQPYAGKLPKFVADKKGGFAGLASHLVDEGYKSITFLSRDISHDQDSPGMKWHVASLTEAFQEAKTRAHAAGSKTVFRFHHPKPGVAERSAPNFGEIHSLYAPGYLGMWELIRSGDVPDALMCQVDTWALGALRACAEAGISVPEDMALTGFENDLSSTVGYVPLTSAGQPHREICASAVTELIALIKGEIPLRDRLEMHPCQVIIRQSSVRRKFASLYPSDGAPELLPGL